MPNVYENMLAECDQREDAWRAARLGRVQSPRVGALLSQSGLCKKLLAAVAGAGLQAQDAETGCLDLRRAVYPRVTLIYSRHLYKGINRPAFK